MMPASPCARAAADPFREPLARHGTGDGGPPDTAAIEAVIEAAFWASLRREEGFLPRISLALVAPDSVRWPLMFERRLPLAAPALTRLAAAVGRPGIHLGGWREGRQVFVWGPTPKRPGACL